MDSELSIGVEEDDREPRDWREWSFTELIALDTGLLGAASEGPWLKAERVLRRSWDAELAVGVTPRIFVILVGLGNVEVVAAFSWSEIELRQKTLDPDPWNGTAELMITTQLIFCRYMDVSFTQESLVGLEAFGLHNELLVDLWNELAVKLLDGDLVRRFTHSVACDGGVILPLQSFVFMTRWVDSIIRVHHKLPRRNAHRYE